VRRAVRVAIWVAALLKHVSSNYPMAISLFFFKLTENTRLGVFRYRNFHFWRMHFYFAWHTFFKKIARLLIYLFRLLVWIRLKLVCDSSYQWTCPSDGTCIDVRRRCDGRVDCRDNSDEIDCQPNRCITLL
jgi:hypothetical protein